MITETFIDLNYLNKTVVGQLTSLGGWSGLHLHYV